MKKTYYSSYLISEYFDDIKHNEALIFCSAANRKQCEKDTGVSTAVECLKKCRKIKIEITEVRPWSR
jgi:hypothetical protein